MFTTLAIRGSDAFSGVPLGPLRTVLPTDAPTDLAELTASVQRTLITMGDGRGLLVSVDDGHYLDDASAALFEQLVSTDTISVLVTVRTMADVPAALANLWKDGLAERVELQSLTHRETYELLRGILGGAIEESTIERIWNVTEGNPLDIREAVLSSIEDVSLPPLWRCYSNPSRVEALGGYRLPVVSPHITSAS